MPTNAERYPSDILFEDLCRLVPSENYPDDIEPVPEPRISGRAFFPGGDGVYLSEGSAVRPAFPVGGVMVVGRDFDTRENFEDSRNRGKETSYTTWEETLLQASGIPLERCFFTNAYMGLRKQPDTNQGELLGHRSELFLAACRKFFLHQLEFVRPSLLLTLGTATPPFLASISTNLPASWQAGSLKAIDEPASEAFIKNVRFQGCNHTLPAIIALIHPSQRARNVWRRKYANKSGDEAEVTMLREAIACTVGGT